MSIQNFFQKHFKKNELRLVMVITKTYCFRFVLSNRASIQISMITVKTSIKTYNYSQILKPYVLIAMWYWVYLHQSLFHGGPVGHSPSTLQHQIWVVMAFRLPVLSQRLPLVQLFRTAGNQHKILIILLHYTLYIRI